MDAARSSAMGFEVSRETLAAKFETIFPHLDERQRRLLMGAEARGLGHGGVRLVRQAWGGGAGGDAGGAAGWGGWGGERGGGRGRTGLGYRAVGPGPPGRRRAQARR